MELREAEAVLLENLDWIERVVGSMCRRNGLWGDDAEDFGSWVKVKLMEDDYAIFRKFRGESAMTTYLTVVISMMFREYRVSRWGRWRPSVAARRHGAVGVRLEMLVNRDGYSLDQAVEVLSTGGTETLTAREAAELVAEFPRRATPREISLEPQKMANAASSARADETVTVQELEEERRSAEDALSAAMQRLDPEDRLIVRMRFWEGMTVADISRGLDLEQKPLYRRLDRVLARLRDHLEREGVSRETVLGLLEPGDPEVDVELDEPRLSNLQGRR